MIKHRSPENYDPITWFGRVPIFATTIIVALYVVSMVVVTLLLASDAKEVLAKLTFDSGAVLRDWELWRCLTYAFVNPPDPWFIIALVLFYLFASEVEQHLGTKGFLRVYLGFVLLGPSLLVVASMVTSRAYLLMESWANLAVVVAFATINPNRDLLLKLSAKLFALILVGSYVFQAIRWNSPADCLVIIVTALFAWYVVRYVSGCNLHFLSQLRPTSHRTKSPRPRGIKTCETDPIDPHRIVDPILEKISREGLASLTRRDREQLEKARTLILLQ